MSKIDICIVAGQRPDLLARTLSSFEERLFRNFTIGRMIANIDPIFGSLDDGDRCVEVIRQYDRDAVIFRPEEPNFASAVARIWASSNADLVLHLEDDWLLRKPVMPSDILPHFLDERTGQVSFNHAHKNWNARRRGPYCYIRRPRRLLGIQLPLKIRIPNFLTGPSFYRGSLARSAADLLDPAFDPEKQFCRGLNPRLEAHVFALRNRIIGESGDYYIEDLGRPWREARGIEKRLIAGQSYWSDTPPAVSNPLAETQATLEHA